MEKYNFVPKARKKFCCDQGIPTLHPHPTVMKKGNYLLWKRFCHECQENKFWDDNKFWYEKHVDKEK